jgi:hypothetical protein
VWTVNITKADVMARNLKLLQIPRLYWAVMENSVYLLKQACAVFYVVRASFAKFGLHAGNIKFNT